jgi:hypothetical protein
MSWPGLTVWFHQNSTINSLIYFKKKSFQKNSFSVKNSGSTLLIYNYGLSKLCVYIYIYMCVCVCKFLFLKRIPAPLCNHHKSYHHLISTDQKIIYQFHTSLYQSICFQFSSSFPSFSANYTCVCTNSTMEKPINCKDRRSAPPPKKKHYRSGGTN